MKQPSYKIVVLLIVAILISGCSNQKKYNDSKAFDNATENHMPRVTLNGMLIQLDDEFDHHTLSGEATIRYFTGQEYRGMLKNGMRNGTGSYYDVDGVKIYEGEWESDKMHGQGTFYLDGESSFYQGIWEKGDPIQGHYSIKKNDGSSEIEEGYLYKGVYAIPPQFGWSVGFSEGLSFTYDKASDGWGFINRKGDFVISPIFEPASQFILEFQDGVTLVEKDGAKWLIDTMGNKVAALADYPLLDGMEIWEVAEIFEGIGVANDELDTYIDIDTGEQVEPSNEYLKRRSEFFENKWVYDPVTAEAINENKRFLYSFKNANGDLLAIRPIILPSEEGMMNGFREGLRVAAPVWDTRSFNRYILDRYEPESQYGRYPYSFGFMDMYSLYLEREVKNYKRQNYLQDELWFNGYHKPVNIYHINGITVFVIEHQGRYDAKFSIYAIDSQEKMILEIDEAEHFVFMDLNGNGDTELIVLPSANPVDGYSEVYDDIGLMVYGFLKDRLLLYPVESSNLYSQMESEFRDLMMPDRLYLTEHNGNLMIYYYVHFQGGNSRTFGTRVATYEFKGDRFFKDVYQSTTSTSYDEHTNMSSIEWREGNLAYEYLLSQSWGLTNRNLNLPTRPSEVSINHHLSNFGLYMEDGIIKDLQQQGRKIDFEVVMEALENVYLNLTTEQKKDATLMQWLIQDMERLYQSCFYGRIPFVQNVALVNQVSVNIEVLSKADNNAMEIFRSLVKEVLSDPNVQLIRTPQFWSKHRVAWVNHQYDFEIQLDQSIADLVNEHYGIQLLVGRYTFFIDDDFVQENLSDKQSLRITVKPEDVESGKIRVEFMDQSRSRIQSLVKSLRINIPVDIHKENVSLFFKIENDYRNIGGLYNLEEQSIQTEIRDSGEYKIQENRMNFKDLEDLDDEDREAIERMATTGIIQGRTDMLFEPDKPLTRAEFAVAMINVFFVLDRNAEASFTDVPKNLFEYAHIASAEEADIVSGYDDGTFRGDEPIIREQLISIGARALHEKRKYLYPENSQYYLPFDDIKDFSEYAIRQIPLVFQQGIIEIDGKTSFKPREVVTRAEAAVFVDKLYQKIYGGMANFDAINNQAGPEIQSQYILPNSHQKLLGTADIESLTMEELRLARNEIFARHGYAFKSEDLQQYFKQKEWYSINDSYREDLLSDIEKKNAEFILEYEKSRSE
ncbi:S-layer homology domain-containing protein [Anoxynatronum sibiricum]|uniref:S-layer homology domain-containing protein n=1 Tax=Anoxynatronum sibiricum TaxID=210623 RepID=A0ABU9VY13_9CLOT